MRRILLISFYCLITTFQILQAIPPASAQSTLPSQSSQQKALQGYEWKYLSVILVLLSLIGFLFYLRRKNNTSLPHQNIIFKQIYLNSHHKLLSIQKDDKTYLVLCSQKEMLLLDTITQKQQNKKDFTQFIREE